MLTAETEYVLRTIEERGIRFVRLWFTDVLGFLKSFTITSQELEGAFLEGWASTARRSRASAASRSRT
jgi:glutamine synthetase